MSHSEHVTVCLLSLSWVSVLPCLGIFPVHPENYNDIVCLTLSINSTLYVSVISLH